MDPQEGYVSGEIFDDITGLPLSGAKVLLVMAGGINLPSPIVHVTDNRGRYRFTATQGLAAVTIQKEGYIEAYRTFIVQSRNVVFPLDTRLSPAAAAVSFNPIVGANFSLQSNRVGLEIPPSAFSDNCTFSMTEVGFQGLPAPLPSGWAPV